jgi:transcriptional regulator with XRE-family HTH domain
MNERLKKLRKTLELTQQEFAVRIGMKQNTIATYEMGRSIPSDLCIRSICREFNVNEQWLRDGTGEMFKLSKEEEIASWVNSIQVSEDFKKRFISVLSKLDVDDWELIANMAETLVRQRKKDESNT